MQVYENELCLVKKKSSLIHTRILYVCISVSLGVLYQTCYSLRPQKELERARKPSALSVTDVKIEALLSENTVAGTQ